VAAQEKRVYEIAAQFGYVYYLIIKSLKTHSGFHDLFLKSITLGEHVSLTINN
jgi:hypothetical protein